MTVLQFRKYRPGNPKNGECYVIENNEAVTPGDYGFVHVSASGDSSAYWGGFANMAEAEAEALQEAQRRDCAFIPGGGA